MLGLGFVVGISVSVAYAVVADDLICAQCVDKSDLATNSVGSSKIINQSVKSGDLATNSVGSKKIINQSIKSGDLAPNSVGSSKIKDHSVKKVDLDQGAGTSFYKETAVDGGTNGFVRVTAMCDSGDMVVGGGFNVGCGSAVPARSFPIATNDGWEIVYFNSLVGCSYTSYAICQDFRPLH